MGILSAGEVCETEAEAAGPQWSNPESSRTADQLLHPRSGKHCLSHGTLQGKRVLDIVV